MFETCYLHIGSPKTGTSSIQNTMHANAAILRAHSIEYPTYLEDYEGNHAYIVSCFHHSPGNLANNIKRGLSHEEIAETSRQTLEQLLSSSETTKLRKLVISSEAFFTLQRDGVEKLRKFLELIACNVKVIAYVRHPHDYARSMIQQEVKSGVGQLGHFLAKPPTVPWIDLLETWSKEFGSENITLREFAPKDVGNWNILNDFLSLLDFPFANEKLEVVCANEGISAHAVLVADAVTALLQEKHGYSPQRENLLPILGKIQGPAFSLPKNTMKELDALASDQLQYLDKVWGIKFDETKRGEFQSSPFHDDVLQPLAELFSRVSLDTSAKLEELLLVKAQRDSAIGNRDKIVQRIEWSLDNSWRYMLKLLDYKIHKAVSEIPYLPRKTKEKLALKSQKRRRWFSSSVG